MFSPQNNPEWLAGALETLRLYPKPALKNLLREEGNRVGGNFDKLLARIGEKIGPRKIIDYLDRLRCYGVQHIFLFELAPPHDAYLDKLRDPDYIRERLGALGLEGLYNCNHLVLKTGSPTLAHVVHDPENHHLLVKWVETREWEKAVQQGDDVVQLVGQEERSINFLYVDLETGNAEIRIQWLQPHHEKSVQEELEIYQHEAMKLIDFNLFSAVLLEPVINRLIRGQSSVRFRQWEIEMPIGGDVVVEGRGSPAQVFKLGLLYQDFVGRRINGDLTGLESRWYPGKPRRARFLLSGVTDELSIPRPCEATQLIEIVAHVRKFSRMTIEMPELHEVAAEEPELVSVLKKLDRHLTDSGETRVEARTLADKESLSLDLTERAFRQLHQKFPQTFQLVIEENITYIEFMPRERPLRAGYPWTYLRELLGKSFLAKAARTLILAVIVVLVGVFLRFMIENFLELLAKFPQPHAQLIISIAAGLILLMVASLIYFLFGPQVVKGATELIERIAALFKGATQVHKEIKEMLPRIEALESAHAGVTRS